MEYNEIKISIEERDLVSDFLHGMKGIFPSIVTWKDIMPVVKKIAEVFPKLDKHYDMRDLKNGLLIDVDIKRVCLAVIDFVKWYDNQKQSI